MQWPPIFTALQSRNYRLFFTGQMVSLMGTWMSQTASLWLVYHLSSSPFLLGLVGFVSLVPIFFLAPVAGVLIDRVNRHRLLVGTQVASMLQSFALAALALTGTITVTHLVLLSLAQGFINALDMPTRQALVVAFVERKEHLGNAIALNSSLFNLARLTGPAIAGFLIAAIGPGMCYLLDGLSYAAVVGALLAMRLRRRPPREGVRHPWVELKQGFHYAFGFVPIGALILLVAAISATGFSYTVLTPMFARDVFHGDARTLGWLMSCSGVGALAGALYLGSRRTVRGLGRVIAFGGSAMGLGLIGFALSRWLPLSLPCLTLVGMGGVLLMASSNTLVQTMVQDDMRGRVMSIFSMAFTGTMPLGNLLAGYVAGRVGPAVTLAGSGALCILIALVFLRAIPRLRAAAAPVLAKLDPSEVEPVLPPPGSRS
ncbi:MAG: MFS transporter [Verrucomicrobiae bacterium]|nr:MFS transporter [Verrucomicrobiae bacterium]MCP5525112.1 MFS transporter [Verrucomicrobiales bacterium]